MRRMTVGVLTAVVMMAVQPTAREQPSGPARVPLVAGLTITGAITSPYGDSEAILTVRSVEPDSYRLSFSAEVPDGPGAARSIAATRRVLMRDHRDARTMRNWYGEQDPETFPGTTPFFSGAIIEDLRKTGKAAITLLVPTASGTLSQTIVRELPGTLVRVEPTPVAVEVLVNGRVVAVPTIHATAELAGDQITRSVDLHVIDDPENPIIVRWRDQTRSSRIVRLDFPAEEARAAVERDLTARKTADVYGIYFGFGSAAIRPESDRVLKEIADVLQRNPEWRLRIDGHTDGIGSEAANLDLSRRRSAAVREVLITRFGIAPERLSADGKGETSPKASNDTPEGRAQNRRVELTRQ